MKVLWIIPISITNNTFMVDIKNKFARSFIDAGLEMETVAGYEDEAIGLDDFSKVVYFKYKKPKIIFKLFFHVKMAREIFKSDADVVMLGYSAGHFIPFAFFVRLLKKTSFKIVLDIRTVPVDLKKDFNSLLNQLRYGSAVWLASFFCDGVTCITSFLAERLEGKFSKLRGKTHVLSTAADFEQLAPDKAVSLRDKLGIRNRFVILYHGILSPNRGIQRVIEAVSLCRRDMPEILFMIVGSGPAEKELLSLAEKTGAKENVLFVGKVPYLEIRDYIRSSDIGIVPMPDIDWWNLNSPIKLKEYLAMGLPFLATDIQSHRQVVEQCGGGILMPDNLPETIIHYVTEFRLTYKTSSAMKSRSEVQQLISYQAEAVKLKNYFNDLFVS